MTYPTTIGQRREHSDDDGQYGDAVEQVARAEAAVPSLAAVQRRYEEAGANIVAPTPASSYAAPDGGARYPATEEIDVRALKPPVAQVATPPTEAMSLAAILLAGQLVSEQGRS